MDLNTNDIIKAFLRKGHEAGEYDIVKPETGIDDNEKPDEENIRQSIEYYQKELKVEGYDFSDLIENLYRVNRTPTLLTIPSAPEEGYVIDHDGKFARYLDEEDGWQKWPHERPEVKSWMTISLPVYDAAMNAGLIYTDSYWSDELFGVDGIGWVIAFQFRDGEMIQIGNQLSWMT